MGPAGCVFLLPLLLGISGTDEEEPKNLVTSSLRTPENTRYWWGHFRSLVTKTPKTMIITVSRIVPYPDFQRNASSAIAVAELAHLVSFGPTVLPICLPSSAVQLKNSTSCWVTGWGNSGISQWQ
ncbi:serine protease 27-like isoform X2 [Balaenoptera ricei]|uniref:serine protease 27-like isoform X2 n=1 Tax=Balaenoptera ricei TaxID=2746895 RepID=UPI0028BD58FA|nr:serine protease 27-like isoform X2 [Balaenoptera ricei]